VDLAEEALQDAFLVVWRKARTYRGGGQVAAWLWGIARRCLANLARRAARRAGPEANLPGTAASRPLLALPPLHPAPPRSPKAGVGLVKRVVHKLVGWQIDPVIEHVNRLHRAVLEAIESQDRDKSR
jgi:DNA-directed RNA polymerase specialized sigma24 family protein